ncbi:polysaccharide biosynthesis/export family protein [Alteromonas ponticola]|uniref:Polysaccharide biosynthesis/export family protein n=1 Tax=Alteromonas aquimaris TaxID=2998417 RepID=A0ABT3P424_9ALTE|nr:polysaccharide biosynthesis/export family protein [Alteromonas aquimaris]MCW8107515.1 polysaccharide biosynthesis/export family protein [Alteromonas aquimaris]
MKNFLSAVVFLFLTFTIFDSFAQSLEQMQELRNQSQNQSQQQSGNTDQQGTPNQISPFELSTDVELPQMQNQRDSMGRFTSKPRSGIYLPGEPTVQSVFPLRSSLLAPPFAANLFIGGFESERTTGINENYLIAPGDQISIWMWGAANYSAVATVDNQGNIFIPNVGPIHLADAPASSVNALVQRKIREVYTNDVEIYIDLLTATPVSVFISGPVVRPGQYAGQASDSVLYYLRRAGGIDFQRGSFRNVQIIREDQVVTEVDLYEFAKFGKLPDHQFKDGDIILVRPIGKTVTVERGAKNGFTFEFESAELTGEKLNTYALPDDFSNHVAITGLRNGKQFARYLTIEQFNDISLKSGDIIEYMQDHEQNVYRVSVAGSFSGQSQFIVKKGTRIKQLLDYISVTPSLSDTKNIYLLRESVADKQAEIIEAALQRLERSIYTAPISSSGEGAIRVQEASLVSDFIERAREVEPLGKVIISEDGAIANILLEPNDTIYIPAATDLIHIGGEVLVPQSVVYNPNADMEDYLAWAGGFTQRADSDRILIIKKNGNVQITSLDSGFWFSGSGDVNIEAGDQVVVLPSIEMKSLQAIKDITQIIYQIAIAANVAVR